MTLKGITDAELKLVQKPAQYLGAELNAIFKAESEIDIRFCLAFPDTYEVGMSHIGMQILYEVINQDKKAWAERAFCPLPDMEKLLRSKKLPLTSLEAKRPLNAFDVVGFSLQYELCATGILTMLDLGGIPFLAKDRSEDSPLVVGGGPVAYHPEPFSDFFDAFLIGDGEEMVLEFIQALRAAKAATLSRADTLKALSKVQGVYVPSLFEVRYENDTFLGFIPKLEGYESVRRQVLPTLENVPYPTKPIVPTVKAVHDRLSVEVMRGCVRGCRFCQAGYLYRPQRERKPEDVLRIVNDSLKNTGYEEVSLLSLSTADYCSILPLVSKIKEKHCNEDDVVLSFPSTRVDALKPELLEQVQDIRRAGFTMAPEAGTQRLRNVINKGVTDEEILETCSNVFRLGWDHVKLYFMIGLPTETEEDLRGIVELGRKVKLIAGQNHQVTVSVSTLVPKPHTPFQWARQISDEETQAKQEFLLREMKKARVNFRYHRSFSTFLEGVFARGDRRLSTVLLKAYELGSRLDGWVEELSRENWMKAFSACGVEPQRYLAEREISEALPWDHISCDIPKRYFEKEWLRALSYRETPDCLTATCSSCGACDYDSHRNILFDRDRTSSRLKIINPAWEKTAPTSAPMLLPSQSLEAAPSQYVEEQPEFGSGSLDYLPVDQNVDFPFKHPEKAVLVHENTPTFDRRNPLGRPERDAVQRVRARYEKVAAMKFTGHLELSAVLFRAARRAGIQIAFTRGFNPKPKLIFGPPLQLGVESIAEYVDFFLLNEVAPHDLLERMNTALPKGITLTHADSIELKASALQEAICSQRFEVQLNNAPDISLWRDLVVTREKDRLKKTIALKDTVQEITFAQGRLQFDIIADPQAGSIKPLEVVACVTGMNAEGFDVRKVDVRFRG